MDLGTDKRKEVKLTNPLHPMLERCHHRLEPLFVQNILPASGHGLLATPEACDKFMEDLPDFCGPLRENLTKLEWNKTTRDTPAQKWEQFKAHVKTFLKGQQKAQGKNQQTLSATDRARLELLPVEIVMRHTYPRLDVNVSTHRNHLLKSPFCVHPKTGRVCVPIDDIASFDPWAVPTLAQLERELAASDDVQDWHHTSLQDYFGPFEKKFLVPLEKDIRRRTRDQSEQQAAVIGDF